MATLLKPLYELLQKDKQWHWSGSCETAFQKAKSEMTSNKVLEHFDVKLPITLACDASAYGIGAMISNINSEGEERPIAFSSRTLSSSERNYSQLEKKALAIIYGVKKFHKYLYRRKF